MIFDLKLPIKIINLKHRNDRKNNIINEFNKNNINNYDFVDAIYGNELELNDNIVEIFKNNDFGNRKSFIGCALTHYNLWNNLLNDEETDYYLIFEDDIKLAHNFNEKINQLTNIFKKKDFVFLGYHMFSDNRNKNDIKKIYDIESNITQLCEYDEDLYIGGFFSYSINKSGAKKLINYINQNGIKHGIDYLIKIINNQNTYQITDEKLNIYEIQPFITFSAWTENNNNNIDSDIQYNFDCFDFRLYDIHELSKYYKLDKNKVYGHDYIPIYEMLIKKNKNNIKNLLEIGIGCIECEQMTHMLDHGYKTGNSLRFWRDYLPNANIVGIDIYKEALFTEERIETYECDQSKYESLDNLINLIDRQFEIIIDDGSHVLEHQLKSFIKLEQMLCDDGIYIIEDVLSSYIEIYKNLSCFNDNYRNYIINKYDIYYYDRNEYSYIKDSSYMVVFKKKHNKCIYVNSDNHYGLGNTMFQIATASYYCEKHGYELYLNENSEWLKYGTGNMFNKNQAKLNYLDTIFKNIKRTNNTSNYNEKVYNDCYTLNYSINNSEMNKILIEGWSQNIYLFYEVKDSLFKYFDFNDNKIINDLNKKYNIKDDEINVLIGVRIGIDGAFKYGNPYINKSSYSKVLDLIIDENKGNNKKVNFFVISDSNEISCMIDKKYNVKNIIENDIYQFYFGLMCNHFILSESTFHYWIALLASIKNPKSKVYIFKNTDIVNKHYITDGLLQEYNWNIIDTDDDKDFVFIKGYDQHGYDINYVSDKSMPILKEIALNDSNCIGFNTLGFFKNKLSKLSNSQYFNENDGIYIKSDIYNKFIKDNIDKKIKLKLLCNWCSSEQLFNEWKIMCNDTENNRWNNIELTLNDEADYYVIINGITRGNNCIPHKTIVFQMEPWVNDDNKNWGVKTWNEWTNPCEKYFLKVFGRNTNDYNNVFWQLELTYKQLSELEYKTKLDEISTICSSKYFDEGHIHRIDFLKFLEAKNDIPLNIFNSDNKFNFKNYKGSVTPYINKSIGYIPYKYYFMVENNYENNFITEKLYEPILCESLCFYYGCPNVSEYIDERAYIQLDMNDFEKSYNIIKRAIDEDWWSQRIEIIRKEKYKLLNEMMFFPRIEKIINNDLLQTYLTQDYYTSAWLGHLKFANYLVETYKPNVIVDLGVDYGHSTFAWAGQGIGKVYGVDWFNGDENAGERNTYNIVKEAYNYLLNKKYIPKDNIKIIKGDFNDVCLNFNETIDILHIDGLHTYEAVKNDFEKWIGKTHENSIILFHDVISYKETVGKFFEELDFPKLYFEHSAGLGVISKNKNIIVDIYTNFMRKSNCAYFLKSMPYDMYIDKNILPNYKLNIKNNVCFIHSCTLPDKGTNRLDYLINYIRDSSLYDKLSKIYINNIGLSIENKYGDKFEVSNYSTETNLFEIPTLNKMIKYSRNNPNTNILYLHSKGITYNDKYEEILDWINLMLYFLIDKHEECLNFLNIVDAVGSNYYTLPFEHYSGNYWWVNTDYFKKLNLISENNVDKMVAEQMLFKKNPKFHAMYTSNVNHYCNKYPRNIYEKS